MTKITSSHCLDENVINGLILSYIYITLHCFHEVTMVLEAVYIKI